MVAEGWQSEGERLVWKSEGALTMSSYQFHFLNKRRALACLVLMNCADDEHAKARANSLTGIRHNSLEIWRGETKVYETQKYAAAN